MKFVNTVLQAIFLASAQAAVAAAATGTAVNELPAAYCYCMPGDPCWPSEDAWQQLNSTVHGGLVATEPIGSPCHDPTYDQAACDALRAEWTNPLTQYDQVYPKSRPNLYSCHPWRDGSIPSSSSVMQTYFANQSCDPFTDRSKPCTLGNYVSYAVRVRCHADVVAALRFAQANNLRVVVRNTGHDFLGRSTGAGALAIWTQSLKTIDFTDWSDAHYSGPAVYVGAGVLGYEVLEAAHAQGLTVVTGECATVGLAGGFTQGGGHSALSTAFGLAADQVLAYHVVTAAGSTVTASPTQNEDLYWALSGGGGGTFGVVIGMVVRAYPAESVGGAAFQLLAPTVAPDQFAAAVSTFYDLLPQMVDHGAMVVFFHSDQMLAVKPVTVWNSTAAYVRDVVLAPFVAALADLGLGLPVHYTELSYRDHYDQHFGPLPQGSLEVQRYQFGGRLIPRSVVEDDNPALQNVLSHLTTNGVLAVGSVANYSKPDDGGGPSNSVHPAWRDALMQMQLITFWDPTAPWEDMVAAQLRMTEEFMPRIEAVTPGSGAYMNEADFRQPNWQEVFYGDNYERLREVKRKWDPQSLFYVLKGVGSEEWEVAPDGRMCRAL